MYLPTKPEAPNTVATIPLTDERPPGRETAAIEVAGMKPVDKADDDDDDDEDDDEEVDKLRHGFKLNTAE